MCPGVREEDEGDFCAIYIATPVNIEGYLYFRTSASTLACCVFSAKKTPHNLIILTTLAEDFEVDLL